MLDYDALRSKVKKLTEKPDKDPGKLPRTEKEMEMVSLQHFLDTHPQTPEDSTEDDIDLSIPSPSKALQRPEILKLRHLAGHERTRSWDLGRSASLSGWSMTSKLSGSPSKEETGLTRSFSLVSGSPTRSSDAHSSPNGSPSRKSRSRAPFLPASLSESFSARTLAPAFLAIKDTESASRNLTPFFQPSELEEIMQPLKEEFIQRQADKTAQARATYEQLNDQLTSELPQLIDLR